MGKLAKMGNLPRKRSPIQTTEQRTFTGQGGYGYVRDPKSELFVLAASNLVAEKTFYEPALERDERYRALIHALAKNDPEWLAGLARYLRGELNMRSAAIVMAAEYVAGGGPTGRRVVESVLLRPDEPAAMLGYWFGTYGRSIPAAIKRGIADALPRLYTERNTVKYDGKGQPFRFGDVVDLVHPKPDDDYRSGLYRYLIDRAHDRFDRMPESLATLRLDRFLWSKPPEERESYARNPDHTLEAILADSGMTWERYSAWIGRPINADEWKALVPSMGLMAIVRNLRNMDSAGVSPMVEQLINAKLGDAGEVRRSRQLPFRYYTAWKQVASLRWGPGLEQALQLSLANVPELPGRTLVLVDCSGSMGWGWSERTTVSRAEQAAVFGCALALRAEDPTLVAYDTRGIQVPVHRGGALLRTIDSIPALGGGTATMEMLRTWYTNHDRVIVVTDEQARDDETAIGHIKAPIYTFNLGGYSPAQMAATSNRHTFAGVSDAAFTLIEALEAGGHGSWPWS